MMKKNKVKDNFVLKEVKEIYAFMKDNGLEVLDYRQKHKEVRLVRKHSGQMPIPVMAAPAMTAGQPVLQTMAVQQQFQGESIKSPLMGIFFRSASPASPPFVREGETAKQGQVLCLIEAMKVFNEVKAEFDCVIKQVLVENGKPVKPGTPLFAIERK